MNQSVKIALGISITLSIYMLTGLAGCDRSEPVVESEPAKPVKTLMTVRVEDMVAAEISRKIVMTGKTLPSRSVDLKAETSGKIVFVEEKRGRPVAEGGLIAEIEINDREERLEQAKASLSQARLEYESALNLNEKELRSDSQVAQALSVLRGAEQVIRMIELDIRNTRLIVPFDGVLQERAVEVGDYLGVGDPVARIIDLDPLVISGEATEMQIKHLNIGELGRAHLPDGSDVSGRIRYVASEANMASRTFLIELEVDNPDFEIRAGLTARMEIETEKVMAYRISAALVSFQDDGSFGVKIVDEDNKVVFVKGDIVASEPDALWLGSLPDRIRLITSGQGFVRDGDEVEIVISENSSTDQ